MSELTAASISSEDDEEVAEAGIAAWRPVGRRPIPAFLVKAELPNASPCWGLALLSAGAPRELPAQGGAALARRRYLESAGHLPCPAGHARRRGGRPRRARGGGAALCSTSKVVVNLFYVAIEVPGFTRRDLTP